MKCPAGVQYVLHSATSIHCLMPSLHCLIVTPLRLSHDECKHVPTTMTWRSRTGSTECPKFQQLPSPHINARPPSVRPPLAQFRTELTPGLTPSIRFHTATPPSPILAAHPCPTQRYQRLRSSQADPSHETRANRPAHTGEAGPWRPATTTNPGSARARRPSAPGSRVQSTAAVI